MPRLNCTVCDCTHNKDNLCCLDSIKVGNSNAVKGCETECDSFTQKDDLVKKLVSSVEQPVDCLAIQCDACECVYNENKSCTADNVCICGSSCCSCADTQCNTFKRADCRK